MNSNDLITIITALSGVIEKSFAFAEANAKRRHDETMYELETNRIMAKAEADLKTAQAEEIRHRIK